MRTTYPFTAIVGQERMKRALILNAINPQIGGVLIRGERGTAKSTAARALAALLPVQPVVKGCPFSCSPDSPAMACSVCLNHSEDEGPLPTDCRPTPFIDLPVSATEDRVVGTLDIEQAIQHGERRFEPGVLAAANRGVLYVDEVNLLDDHVVDLLLDSAAMGVNVVEREGISFQHPARFVLVGSMNPEEGDLRPQLLDRFAHAVDVVGLTDPKDRVEILRRRVFFEQDPDAFAAAYEQAEAEMSDRIVAARSRYSLVEYTDKDLYTIAALTSSFKVDGHRADIVILKTARAVAAFEDRLKITDRDILLAAELALPHRMKKQPFQDAFLNPEQLEANMRKARSDADEAFGDDDQEASEAEGGSASTDEKKVPRAMSRS